MVWWLLSDLMKPPQHITVPWSHQTTAHKAISLIAPSHVFSFLYLLMNKSGSSMLDCVIRQSCVKADKEEPGEPQRVAHEPPCQEEDGLWDRTCGTSVSTQSEVGRSQLRPSHPSEITKQGNTTLSSGGHADLDSCTFRKSFFFLSIATILWSKCWAALLQHTERDIQWWPKKKTQQIREA